MTEQLDHPFLEVVDNAIVQMAKGATVYQKFSCDGCGARQTMSEPNRFFTQGKCEECGYTTNIELKGCNFLLVMTVPT